MKILVTGGTGFIGSHLIEELIKKHQVYALVRSQTKLKNLSFKDKISVINGDLFTSEKIPEDIEYVIHLAGITKVITPHEFFNINVQGTAKLIDRIKKLRKIKKFILISSIAAAGPSDCQKPLTEDDQAKPVSLYGKSKLKSEIIVKKNNSFPFIVIRPPIVFGPRDLDFLDLFSVLKKGIIPNFGNKIRKASLIYIKDLVSGILKTAFSNIENETFYITNKEPIEWESFMRFVAQLIGKKNMLKINIPEYIALIAAKISDLNCRIFRTRKIFNSDKIKEIRQPCWECSGEKIETLLHFTPIYNLEESLRFVIEWYKKNNLL